MYTFHVVQFHISQWACLILQILKLSIIEFFLELLDDFLTTHEILFVLLHCALETYSKGAIGSFGRFWTYAKASGTGSVQGQDQSNRNDFSLLIYSSSRWMNTFYILSKCYHISVMLELGMEKISKCLYIGFVILNIKTFLQDFEIIGIPWYTDYFDIYM